MRLTLATWNVNSVRLRLEQLGRVVETLAPDVLCLQETKVADPLFPREGLAALGFDHLAILGQPGYNGVAIASRHPLTDVTPLHWCGRRDCRHLAATVAGVEVHCLYVPAGGDVPDAEQNPKFAHKLDFMTQMAGFSARAFDADSRAVLLGDLNVAPLPDDVWDHKKLRRVVTHTPIEVAHLEDWMAAGPWIDAVRGLKPPPEPVFTWWSYRARDWRAANRGRRLDHVWTTPKLADAVRAVTVMTEARDWTRPSDHVPVAVTLEI